MSTTAATSGTKTEIRLATAGDIDGVFGLVEQLADTYAVERDAFDSAFAEAIDDGTGSVLLVAGAPGDQLVGYALMTIARLMYTRDDAAQIQELIVHSDARGKGIGSQLVWAIEDLCRLRGIGQLTVASSRAPAFYDRLDYRSTADFLKKVFNPEH